MAGRRCSIEYFCNRVLSVISEQGDTTGFDDNHDHKKIEVQFSSANFSSPTPIPIPSSLDVFRKNGRELSSQRQVPAKQAGNKKSSLTLSLSLSHYIISARMYGLHVIVYA